MRIPLLHPIAFVSVALLAACTSVPQEVRTADELQWDFYLSPSGFSISYPFGWDTNDAGGEGLAFFPKPTEDVKGDGGSSEGMDIYFSQGELPDILIALNDSENGNCTPPVDAFVGPYDAAFTQCISAFDGSPDDHYFVPYGVGYLHFYSDAHDPDKIYSTMRGSFRKAE